MAKDALDPTGVIAESFKIEGIGPEDCRGIFLDWALKMPVDADNAALVGQLLARHANEPQDHPMIGVLRDALQPMDRPRRRGGYRSRPREN